MCISRIENFIRDFYFAEHGNLPIFMAINGNIAYISTDFRHKNNNVNILLEGRKMKIVNIIVTNFENPWSIDPRSPSLYTLRGHSMINLIIK